MPKLLYRNRDLPDGWKKSLHRLCSLGFSSLCGALIFAGPTGLKPSEAAPATFLSHTAPLRIDQAGDQNTSADSVFNWTEVPADQRVPITRAIFDQGGYQLFDDQGETIVVPFVNNNLYAMKFGQSSDGTTYFVNQGTAPVLYLPEGGYLENATVPGARWYPFPRTFHPQSPVYLGIATSYTTFVDMGWYPDMVYQGGYYGHSAWSNGDVFVATPGIVFIIGGNSYHGWAPYHRYLYGHPGYHRPGYYRPQVYRDARQNHTIFGGGGSIRGGSRPYGGGNRSFGGGSHSPGGTRTFRGTHTSAGGTHNFGGGTHNSSGGTQTFRGTQPPTGVDHSFGGGSHSPGGTRNFGGGSHSPGGTRNFGGGSHSTGGTHSFGGGSGDHSHSFGGGHSSSSGNHSSGNDSHSSGGGGHSSDGGGHSSGGDGGGHSSGGDGGHKKQ